MDDLISRQAAIDAVKKNTFRLTFAEEQNCEGHVAWSAEAVYSDVMEGALLELPSAQLGQQYTNEELMIFQHGISLSLLSKRSAQHWRYDENTATEIKFLERLYEKVSANTTLLSVLEPVQVLSVLRHEAYGRKVC